MANAVIENLPKNTVKLTVTVPLEEMQPYLQDAAAHLSEHHSIHGFRPGKAPYDAVKNSLGEMAIYEEALESIIRKTFVEALMANNIETVGSPKIDLEKIAPGNDLVYIAEVALMPKVTEMADWHGIQIKKKAVEVADRDIDLVLKDLQRMQTKEMRAVIGAETKNTDKAVIDIKMTKDNVPVEGGSSANHGIYMREDYYIPGMKEKIMGMKEGEQKTFTLPFPKDHVQKSLAGTDIVFDVTLKELYHLEPPALDDTFAKTLGQETFTIIKEKIKENLQNEKNQEEQRRQEKEILEGIAKKSQFEDIPDLLLNEEINKMIDELNRALERQGVAFDDYLKNIKKTLPELKMDFTPEALNRIKIGLILRAIAKKENITVAPEELDKSLNETAAQHEDEEIKKKIYHPNYRDYTEAVLRNRKVLENLKKTMITE